LTFAFRRTDWIIGLAVVLLVVLATVGGLLRGPEGWAYDIGAALSNGRSPGSDVVVVAVDDTSLERLGAWPWSRYTLGEINALVARGDPRVTGYALPLETPQNEHAQDTLRALYQQHRGDLDPGARDLFERAIREMGTDRVLAASFRRSGHVVLGARFSAASSPPASLPSLPEAMSGYALRVSGPDGYFSLAPFRPQGRLYVDRVYPPVDQITAAADGVALAERTGTGAERTQRALNLALEYDGTWLASFPLLLYAHARGLDASDIEVTPGRSVTVGNRVFHTGPGLGVYPAYYHASGGDGDAKAFRVVSAAAVQAREVPASTFRNKIVLVGITAPSLVAPVHTPAGDMMPVLAMAHQVSSLLNDHLYRVPDWAVWGRIGAFALVALYLVFLLPRLGAGTGLAVTGLLAVGLVNAELFSMVLRTVWVPLVAPFIALAVGHGLLAGKRAVASTLSEFQAELSDSNRELGEAYRREGRLDEALRKFQRCNPEEETLERMYALGLDYERRRRFPQAAEAFRWCQRCAPGFRDAGTRASRNEKLQNSVMLGRPGKNGGSTQTLVVEDETVQKPMLGRYQLERELGKGAMGTVYLGRDPKIGREVAIKTMALDVEFEGESLKEIKARFLREAETAGRLSHPNIVAVHDVGEEQDLAWIAMDFLPGEPMSRFVEPENLLPPEEVFEVLAQVADALAAAHESKVVHRDIKPDNIIYDRKRGTATVTDFGVACLVDHTHTRSGTILGSPSYMSPEQLAGKRVDGRSDIFSMGVTLYQLLVGVLPFNGDSMSNLMYVIANERQREVRRIRPDLPPCATTITNRAMEKDPDRRYVAAAQLAQALRRCRGKCA